MSFLILLRRAWGTLSLLPRCPWPLLRSFLDTSSFFLLRFFWAAYHQSCNSISDPFEPFDTALSHCHLFIWAVQATCLTTTNLVGCRGGEQGKHFQFYSICLPYSKYSHHGPFHATLNVELRRDAPNRLL